MAVHTNKLAIFKHSYLSLKNRSNFGEVDVAPAKNDKVNKVEKVIKINSRIISKPYAHLQTIMKTCAKFQKDRYKIV